MIADDIHRADPTGVGLSSEDQLSSWRRELDEIAETGDATGSVLELGRAKLERKGCDLLVVNEVGVDKTFGADDTTVHVLRRGSDDVVDIGPASKTEVSHGIWDVVVGSVVAD